MKFRRPKLRRLAGPAGRAGWGLADQALSSLSNLAVGVVVARSSTVADFGVYALAFGGYTIALNVSRAVSTEPLAVRHSGERTPAWQRAVRASTATALLAGFVGLLVGLAIAAFPGVPSRGVLIAFAVTMPGLLLQDAWRWAFFSVGEGQKAFVNDLIWLLAMLAIFGGLYLTGSASAFSLTLAWGLGAVIAAVAGRFQAGVSPRRQLIREWLKTHRDLTPKYMGEMLAVSGTIQIYMLGITAAAGLAATAGIRGAQVLLGPVNVLNQGIRMISVPGPSTARAWCLDSGAPRADPRHLATGSRRLECRRLRNPSRPHRRHPRPARPPDLLGHPDRLRCRRRLPRRPSRCRLGFGRRLPLHSAPLVERSAPGHRRSPN